jgi:hypothetical protein
MPSLFTSMKRKTKEYFQKASMLLFLHFTKKKKKLNETCKIFEGLSPYIAEEPEVSGTNVAPTSGFQASAYSNYCILSYCVLFDLYLTRIRARVTPGS